ncbi:MAG: chitobiase/beta-hexosaminidase C-terminal domain-containing protein [Bacteroidales bacterium]|nr:chitobiase/beta-hexosaminidase C-terminal domain-containing protein [Bacteroidales bacterium]
MKKLYSLMLTVLFVGLTFLAQAQDTIAAWHFPSATALTATAGSAANVGVATVSNSNGQTLSYTASSFSIYCNTWTAKDAHWLIGPLSFEGFTGDMKVQFQAWSSGTGPKTFFYEMKIGKDGDWKRGGSYDLTSNQKTLVGPLALPSEELAGQKEVYFRLLVDPTTTAVNGNALADGGTSRVAEILITGKAGAPVVTTTAAPEFNPESRTFFNPFDMKMTCKTPDAVIYYTMDGTVPTDSTAKKYDGSLIRIDTTTTVKAFAVAAGMDPSEVVEATYTFAKPAVQFLSLEDGGTYLAPIFLEVSVENFKLANAGEGDGYLKFESPIIDEFVKAHPELAVLGIKNPVYCDQFMFETMSSFPIDVAPGKYTVTASLVNMDSVEFEPAIAHTITIEVIEPAIYTTAPDTLILPEWGSAYLMYVMGEGLTDSIQVVVSNENFMVVNDDMKPVSVLSPEDLNEVYVGYVGPKDTLVYADLYLVSDTISTHIVLNYGLGWDTLPAPVFSVPEGTYTEVQTVEITCDYEGAEIYYTIDGTDPDTSDTYLTYKEPIVISETTVLKAYAEGWYINPSPIVMAKYVIEPAGVKEISVVDAKVYPNPATSFVKVEMGDASAQRVEVISMNGQKVYTAANQGDNFTISMSNFTKGVYFIRIITTDNKMVVKKVVKM